MLLSHQATGVYQMSKLSEGNIPSMPYGLANVHGSRTHSLLAELIGLTFCSNNVVGNAAYRQCLFRAYSHTMAQGFQGRLSWWAFWVEGGRSARRAVRRVGLI